MAADRGFHDDVLAVLRDLGDVTSKAMFGGYGIWQSGDMFALISSDSTLYFKASDDTVERYTRADSARFMDMMPYYEVPAEVMDDEGRMLEWAQEAAQVGHATAKPKKPKKKKTASS